MFRFLLLMYLDNVISYPNLNIQIPSFFSYGVRALIQLKFGVNPTIDTLTTGLRKVNLLSIVTKWVVDNYAS